MEVSSLLAVSTDIEDTGDGKHQSWMYLVEVVVLLRLEEVEGLPLLFTGSSQQVVEDMVVPMKRHSTK